MISFIQYPPPLFCHNPNPNPNLCLSDQMDCSSNFSINIDQCCAERLSGCHLSLAPPSSSSCTSSSASTDVDIVDINLHRRSGSSNSCSSDDDNHRRFEEDEPAMKSSTTVGWPPISSYRKTTTLALSSSCRDHSIQRANDAIANDNANYENGSDGQIDIPRIIEPRMVRNPSRIKVSMDGAPIVRKLDLNNLEGYQQLFVEIQKLFKFYKNYSKFLIMPHLCSNTTQCIHHVDMHGSCYVLTYKDKDDDWMLVGDTPWKDFAKSAKRIRIMKRKRC